MSINNADKKLTSFDERYNDPDYITDADKAQVEFEVRLIGKLIDAREKKGLSQKELADLAGVKQPAIARLESMKVTPQINTLLKVLQPLGYTLDIVPLGREGKVK